MSRIQTSGLPVSSPKSDVSIFTAAHYLCKKSKWTLSNFKVQKLLYFAQMVSLGRDGRAIFKDDFEAWALGPVNRDLYHEAKKYGANYIKSLPKKDGEKLLSEDKSMLDDAVKYLSDLSVNDLLLKGHWSEGAWAKTYPGGGRNKIISKESMIEEYLNRIKRLKESNLTHQV